MEDNQQKYYVAVTAGYHSKIMESEEDILRWAENTARGRNLPRGVQICQVLYTVRSRISFEKAEYVPEPPVNRNQVQPPYRPEYDDDDDEF